MTGRRYMIMLTAVRPLMPGDPHRDERTWPEEKREVVGPAEYEAAQRIFAGFCALPQVKAGRQRAKMLPLAGSDTHLAGWSAPLVTRATTELVGAGR